MSTIMKLTVEISGPLLKNSEPLLKNCVICKKFYGTYETNINKKVKTGDSRPGSMPEGKNRFLSAFPCKWGCIDLMSHWVIFHEEDFSQLYLQEKISNF